MKEVYTVQLYRQNRAVPPPSIGRDVWEIVKIGVLAGLGYCILVLVLA